MNEVRIHVQIQAAYIFLTIDARDNSNSIFGNTVNLLNLVMLQELQRLSCLREGESLYNDDTNYYYMKLVLYIQQIDLKRPLQCRWAVKQQSFKQQQDFSIHIFPTYGFSKIMYSVFRYFYFFCFNVRYCSRNLNLSLTIIETVLF